MAREVRLVWIVVAALLTVVVVTYARVPAGDLYNVSTGGLGGGFGRGVVELNYPVALVALGVLGVTAPLLSRRRRALAVLAASLCLVVLLPGVVTQSDLDVRWINAVPAAGVALALALSARAPDPGARYPRGDRLRIALAVLLVFCAAPWIAAALGFFLDRVPVLGSIFQTGAIVSYHGDPPHHAVHHGLHHGLDGLILVVTALSLSRVPNRITLFLALMLAYGVADLVNDDWLEQIAERGWTTWTVPSSIEPAANWTWLGVLVATPVIWALWFRQPRSGTITARSNSITTSSC